MCNLEIVWQVSSTEISLHPDHWQASRCVSLKSPKNPNKVLDMPFLVPTAPIKGVWYLDRSTVGTDNA